MIKLTSKVLQMLKHTVLVGLALFCFSTASYAQLNTTQIIDSIFVLSGKGGNIGVFRKTAEQAAMESPLFDLEEDWAVGTFSGEKWISIVYDGI